MSLSALLLAVRNQLRSDLNLTDTECDIQEDGQPPPHIGERYFSIHPNGWKQGDLVNSTHALDEVMGFAVTITKRIADQPQDRLAKNIFLKRLVGMEALMRKVNSCIFESRYTIETNANNIIAAESLLDHSGEQTLENEEEDQVIPVDGFVIGDFIRWEGTEDIPTTHDGTWTWENPDARASQSMTTRFTNCRRIQRRGNVE